MQRTNLKNFLVLVFSLLHIVNSLKCGTNEIEACIECDSQDTTRCKKCEDKYFLVLEGERCIKCDDPVLGMSGCDGNCEMIKSERNVKCEENKCKEGYYELYPGTCAICSFLFEECTKCSYEYNDTQSQEKEFKCLDCSNYYYLSSDGNECKYCYLDYCDKCLNETFCKECESDYVLYPNGKCKYYDDNCRKAIYSAEKESPICLECSTDYVLYPNGSCIYYGYGSGCKNAIYSKEDKIICLECDNYYVLYPNKTCHDYDYYCEDLVYSEEKGKGICLKCKEGYFLDKNDKCSYCNTYQYDYSKDFYHCNKCHLENDKLICDESSSGYFFSSTQLEVKKCSQQISNCNKCSYHSDEDKQNNILKCDECQSGTYLSSDEQSCKTCKENSNGCIICSDNELQTTCDKCSYGYTFLTDSSCNKCTDYFGEGCSSCAISKFDLLPYCSKCKDGYILGYDGKCKHCQNDTNLIGCNSCKVIGKKGYYCTSCQSEYILFEGKCMKREEEIDVISNCKEIENIGTEIEPIYSCIECSGYNNYIYSKKDNNASECVKPSYDNGLYNCYSSKTESIGKNNYTCTKCYSNYNLVYDNITNKNICNSCAEGYYQDDNYQNLYCKSCSYYISSCNKCHQENGIVYCDSCSNNYILAHNRQDCEICPYNCRKCSSKGEDDLVCDQYKIPLFLNDEGEIDSCLNYIDNCGECSYSNISKLICNNCLEDYFLNKDGICEHCYINTNINLACVSCTDDEEVKKKYPCQKCIGSDYFLTNESTCVYCRSELYGGPKCNKCGYIDINGKQEIGCISCYSKLTSDKKCLDIYISDCKLYGPYYDENNKIIYGCYECYENYNLTEEYKCKYIQKTDTIKEKLFPNSLDELIEGCISYNYRYGSYYCTNCRDNYFLHNGICINKLKDNPFLSDCKSLYYTYDKGFVECTSCYKSSIYFNNDKACMNQYYGKCYDYENLGTDIVPLYSCKQCSYTSIIYENGVKTCFSNILNNRCSIANVNTFYYSNIYTCIKCESPYILSYSDYYGKEICKYIYEEEKKNNISKYDSDTGISATNGKCNDGYFTRNGKVCIKCDDENYGMEGCGGKCTFILNREYQLQCEDNKCKDNYFETLPGKCVLCSQVLSSCQKCEYIINEEIPKFQPKRQRELVCTKCSSNNLFLYKGKCLTCDKIIPGCKTCIQENNQIKCSEVAEGYYTDKNGIIKQCFSYCSKCSIVTMEGIDKLICTEVSNKNYYIDKNGIPNECESNCDECTLINGNGVDEIKCTEASYGYYIDQYGKVQKCEENCNECALVSKNGEYKVECQETRYGYFINDKKKCVKCSDEKEGIIGCSSCEYDSSKLKCNYCSSGYEMVDGMCKSYEELYNLEGCDYYSEKNNTYYCTSCNSGYLFITNLNRCVKKTEEINLCTKARAIKSGNKTFYNCTYCNYDGVLVKNMDGYYKCYEYNIIHLTKCDKYINRGTFKEPIFMCESCNKAYYTYYTRYLFTTDEYNYQQCEYNDYTFPNCVKATKIKYLEKDYSSYNTDYYYGYKYSYNCTECELKYAVEYDDYTRINKCTPLECGIPFCKKCADNDVYNCTECNKGYTLNKLGNCYIKPPITPSITFQDIFRFALNGLVSGDILFRYSFYLRGLTKDKISEKHSFIISTMFSSNQNMRNLQESENIDASCEFENQINSDDNSDIKYVDYICSLNTDKDLINDYKLESIQEGDKKDEDNLMAFNLEDLVKNIDDITKYDSNLDNNELNKYLLFTVDNNSKHINNNDYDNFHFTINGVTNKNIPNNIKGILTFNDKDNEEAKCEINSQDKDNAIMECNVTLSEKLKIEPNLTFSFKEREMKGDTNNIYFEGLNEVEIFSSKKDNNNTEKKDNNNKKLKIIIIVVIGVVVVSAVVIITIIICKKCKHSKNENDAQKENNIYKESEEKIENKVESKRNLNKKRTKKKKKSKRGSRKSDPNIAVNEDKN